jgi:hypothetical protein
LRRKRTIAISITLVAFFLFAYLVPFVYTGTRIAIRDTPESRIYGSLTCITSSHLEGYYIIGLEALFIAPGTPPPPPGNWLGTLYQGGHYYFFCNPQYVSIPRA